MLNELLMDSIKRTIRTKLSIGQFGIFKYEGVFKWIN